MKVPSLSYIAFPHPMRPFLKLSLLGPRSFFLRSTDLIHGQRDTYLTHL